MRYKIEDRRKARKGAFGAGYFIIWEIRLFPFPHRSYLNKRKTQKEAKDFLSDHVKEGGRWRNKP